MAGLDWILFDADGVLQRTRATWIDELTAAGGERGEEFVLAVFAAESACVAGGDFEAEMERLRSDFALTATLHEILPEDFWIEVDPAMLGAVRGLRRRGYRCALATNQQNLRGAYMRGGLGFAEVFDEQFYSWELGIAKPDPGYFTAILERIDAPGDRVLFLDDNQPNVDGARTAGLHAELFARDGGLPTLTDVLARHGVEL